MSLQQGVQHLVRVGEHAVSEEEGVRVVRVRRTGDQLGEQCGDGQVL